MATYSFKDCLASIVGPGGSFSIGNDAGAAEEGITIEPTEEINGMTIGAGGEVMHSLHANKSGKVTIRLLKTSKRNKNLQDLYNLQTTSSSLHGQNVITVADAQRGDFISCQQVAFAKAPSLVYAKDGNVNEWEFHAGIIDRNLGSGTPAL